MNLKVTVSIGAILALISATAAALGDVDTIIDHIPIATHGYVERQLAGQLEPIQKSLRLQGLKQSASEINNLNFQLSILQSKKAELELQQRQGDSQLLREALSNIENAIQETKHNLYQARCDQGNLQAGVEVQCSINE